MYIQCDRVATGLPLGPLLAKIFMKSQEDNIIPKLKCYFIYWKQQIDATDAYVESTKVNLF